MEIAIILLLLALTGQNGRTAQELPPPELLRGDWNALLHSDWFASRSFGGVTGREIARAADTFSKLAEHKDALRSLLQGDRSALSGGLQTDEIFETLSRFAALAEGTGGLGSLFGVKSTEKAGAEEPPPAVKENPLAPIANIADAEIICSLTRYFAA